MEWVNKAIYHICHLMDLSVGNRLEQFKSRFSCFQVEHTYSVLALTTVPLLDNRSHELTLLI